jgi:hypothetical protein
MLRFLRDRVPDRKLRLFAVACARRAWPASVEDGATRDAVEVAERFADQAATVKECRAARAALAAPLGAEADWRVRYARHMAKGVAKADAGAAALETALLALQLAGAPALERYEGDAISAADRHSARVEAARQVASVRCLFGNPFRPVAADPSWLTSDVLALAQGIYDERAFDRAPILADALEDAGCADADALAHLRHGGEHARGCWVLDLVLGL